MKYGKLFTKLIELYPEFKNLSANKCSLLTYNELRAIAKVLYPANKDTLNKYIFFSKDKLAAAVYLTLRKL